MDASSFGRERDAIASLYERHARAYERDRDGSLQERAWLDRFLAEVPTGGVILDVGCGTGEPIARYVTSRGFRVVGLDASPTMIELCRARLPREEWQLGDMRQLDLGRRFDGILAWDSFFHLGMAEQRSLFARFAAHSRPGAPLMFTSGTAAGEVLGNYRGEPLYHASLDTAEYEELLASNGYGVKEHVADDAACGGHTVWLAKYRGTTREARRP